MSELLPLETAQQRLFDMALPMAAEPIETRLASGRYLAENINAARTQPAHDLSSLDGYAISGDGPWRVIGESRAGSPFDGSIEANQAVRISTGAWIPHGSDRVLIQENAALSDGELTITCDPPEAGQYIRRAGFDFSYGDQVLQKGTLMGAPQIALALSAGHNTIQISRRPRVALIECGDELAKSANECATNQIPASNNAMIAALAEPLVSEINLIGPVADTMEEMIAALDAAGSAEIIVTSGGASVGDHDLVRPALEEWGAEIDFWKIAIKPGKPLLVARKNKQMIIGLPGNPVSSYVTAFLFLLPLLRQFAGATTAKPSGHSARITADIAPGGTRREFLRAIWDGNSICPIDEQDSSALLALSRANALIERPEHCRRTKAGTDVPFYLLQNGGIA
ncbi:molybdopterin molybdotransferase MoeA [Pontixanthobacter gangjinensis]|uniref:Molybdopterin molybdenumtransferase n=1 Tax=Pontixanthobacter gangjinensis TaxID=1028742 RepID=A0A6I4SMH6_9SPHN|nr:molybdopterin molybdotransferase MoeA [Pontixanthobacter gangjinensis]MXO56923.1 molybdopterin molybdenumtransferase MoeA [Pontixanthobacter gangjinensis]